MCGLSPERIHPLSPVPVDVWAMRATWESLFFVKAATQTSALSRISLVFPLASNPSCCCFQALRLAGVWNAFVLLAAPLSFETCDTLFLVCVCVRVLPLPF